MGETFYDVLEVGADATQAEIEVAYRERVKETHPDLNDAPDASEAFQRVRTAEEVLGNPDERARYDRLGHASYTSHFGATEGGGGSRWDVGANRRAEEGGDDGARASGRSARGRNADRGGGGDDRFGFDPGAYDRTQDGPDGGASGGGDTGSSNGSQRSYDVSGGTETTDGESASAGSTGATASATGATAAGAGAGASTDAAGDGFGDPTDGRHWRERERAQSNDAGADGRESTVADDRGGYSVHDWDDDELDTSRTPYRLQGSEAVVVGIMFVLYPFVAFSAITPQFSLVVNVVVAACALLLTGYLLTMPRIAIYVFGAWSVIAPLAFLAVPALEVVSLLGVIALAGTWIPFGYSLMFMQVLR